MATVAKNQMYPDVHNTENWKYTTTNNIKSFGNKDDAKRFIVGTCNIWKIEKCKNGTTFIQSLLQSIDDMRQTNTAGFEYVDENGDKCYILFLMQVSSDRKALQISHTQHKLSRSGVRKAAVDNVQVEECNAGRWLMQRACNELHLPEQTTKEMMSQEYNTLEYRTPKYSLQQHKLSTKEINEIIKANELASPENENVYFAHKNRYGKEFLCLIPEVSSFCKYISEPDAFLEHLITQIQNVHDSTEFLHQLQYPDGKKCTLCIFMKPTKNYIYMLLEMQDGSVGSQK